MSAIKEQTIDKESDSIFKGYSLVSENESEENFPESNADKQRQMSSQSIHRKSPKKNPTKESTKFEEFRFHHTDHISSSKKLHLARTMLVKSLEKKTDFVKRNSKMSRRMVNRIAFSILSDCSERTKNNEEIDGLLEETYDCFVNKYALKNVGEKKFLEFVASLIKNADFKRSVIYLRLLGLGTYIDTHDYAKPAFVFYTKIFHFMLHSKIGIVVGYDDSADKQMFPTARAHECIKESLEGMIQKSEISNLLAEIDNISTPDPKRINSNGLVELEHLFEIMVEAYERHCNEILI